MASLSSAAHFAATINFASSYRKECFLSYKLLLQIYTKSLNPILHNINLAHSSKHTTCYHVSFFLFQFYPQTKT